MKRLNRETFTNAHSAVVGSAVGFTGQFDILKKYGEELGIETSSASAVPSSLRGLLMHAVKTVRATREEQAQDGGD